MKTENTSSKTMKVGKENQNKGRTPFKVIQTAGSDKEALIGRSAQDNKKRKLVLDEKVTIDQETKKKKFAEASVQTDENVGVVADLTVDEPSVDYWQKLAKTRLGLLNKSLEEVERLKEDNRNLKKMADEATALVEVLQEMIDESKDSEEVDDAYFHPE